jgi:predicted MPP superfamily phosphohydrolase
MRWDMDKSKYDLSNPIPSCLKSVVDLQIEKAKSLQNDNTLSFLFFTDPHITDASSFTDIKTLNYINYNLNIEFAACCGDNLDNAETKQQHLDTASKLIDSLSIEKFFTVKGNHDDNSIQSEGIDNIKHTMLHKEQYEIMFNYTLENNAMISTPLYFQRSYKGIKILLGVIL